MVPGFSCFVGEECCAAPKNPPTRNHTRPPVTQHLPLTLPTAPLPPRPPL
jgi:hypothetical protein